MAISQTSVKQLYSSVIEDVIANCREAFLDDGVDDSVLQDLKQAWEAKLLASKAVVVLSDLMDPAPPPLGKNPKPGAGKKSQNVPPPGVPPIIERTSETAVPPLTGTLNNGSSVQTNPANPQVVNSVHQPLVTNHVNQINRPVNQVTQSLVTQPAQSLVSNQQPQATLLQQIPQPAQQPAQQQQVVQQVQAPAQPPPQQTHHAEVPVHITLPPQLGVADAQPRTLTIQVPPAMLTDNLLTQVITGPLISAALAMPQQLAANLVQQHVTAAFHGLQPQFSNSTSNFQQAVEQVKQVQNNAISQLDGALDTSDEDDDDDDDEDEDLDDDENDDKDEDENDENEGGAEEEPLNSGDDVSDDDPTELFETDNVVVCQYDKITRSRNKWKFYLKDGIMNLNGKDYVFQRANGDAEW